MDERNAKLHAALSRVVVNGDHSDDALSALWRACREYRQSAPGYAYKRANGLPSRSLTSDTGDITVALRDSDFDALVRIYRSWHTG